MTITNVSTYGSLQTLLQNMNQVQSDLNTDQVEVSSNEKSQTFDGLGSNVEQFTALNSQVSILKDYQQSNSTAISQMQSTNTVLGQVQQIATSIQSLIASQQSGTASTASFQQQLKSAQASLISELNTTYGGNYIFGGTKTNIAPVITPLPASTEIGTADAAYYQGSAQDTTTRISESQTIDNSVRADNPAFQQLFAGIAQALSATSGDTTDLQSAENLVQTGVQGVIALQATVNANIVNVQQVNTQSQSLQTYYQGVTDNISQADVVELSTKVAQDQSVLEASFSTFARISSLSLANYLK